MLRPMLAQWLAQVPLFATLPPDELEFLAGVLLTIPLDANQILFREGDVGRDFYIVRSGEIEVVRELDTPDERVIALRHAGEFVGEMSLLNDDLLRTASVRANQPSVLLALAHDHFRELLQRRPNVTDAIVRELSRRLDGAHDEAIRDLKIKNMELRATNAELKLAQTQIIQMERLERELEVAHNIQMSILPKTMPHLAGFELGAKLVPARNVGGDMFDFMWLDDHRLGVVVGDVSDKGVPAAIFMAQARALLRAEATRYASPAEVLKRVNHHLLDMNSEGLFVTVIYGVLDARQRQFTYARAGHDHPLIVDSQGHVSRPPVTKGQLLGVLDKPVLTEQTLDMPHGSLLLLYTDGATDIHNADGVAFGSERLVATVTTYHKLGAQALCDEIFLALSRHRERTPAFDDVTLVAIRAR